ncbi:hypothetical protein FRX31_002409, partial [Thalictrum thalictroides]
KRTSLLLLEEAIEKAKAFNKKTDVDRLNRLYLLPICLLPEKARNIDLRYIDLAADLKKFDKFPWGTVVYDCLADSLETVYKYVKEEKINYGIHGCILAFIIWAYQHVLTLGPRRDSTAEFPRMLGWRDLPAKCRKETTISKLLDNKKRKKPEKDYLYYPRKPTTEEKTIEVVQEAIEDRNELLRRRIAMDLLDCGVKPPQKPKAEEKAKQLEDKANQLEDKAEEKVDDAKGVDV